MGAPFAHRRRGSHCRGAPLTTLSAYTLISACLPLLAKHLVAAAIASSCKQSSSLLLSHFAVTCSVHLFQPCKKLSGLQRSVP